MAPDLPTSDRNDAGSSGKPGRRPGAEHAGRGERTLPEPPPQAVMGLINYLTVTSLDQDYAVVAERREAAGERPPSRAAGAVLAVLAVFGVLIATAAVQTARSADDTATSHEELVKQVQARKAQLADRRERVNRLANETETLQTQYLEATAQGRSVQSRLTSLGVATGADAARGPGVLVRADDGPPLADGENEVIDLDLQKLVNGFWLAGAEAISINGERLTALTAVRQGGAVITVNFRPISPPYNLRVIGDPDTLAARFADTPSGQWWSDLQALYGVELDITNSEDPLTVPAARRSTLRYAHTPERLR
ncbi:DUF881 domain-containing protein [Nocardioides iriomotensis]|uniref:DUF881 domain-containing protein n=1 Tax=Nocardioides iriomotensis TaxID=715784 RepID=A0A4Q5IZJ5_9ACTN|nr:DUF881 domain-containing protein [Nocardioides iriomotensis]RYU11612.1 DUF881 domain-containing protein [Nocardioides iriomotensis]